MNQNMDHQMTDEEFEALRRMMYEISGVRLTEAKKNLVMGRLKKRLRDLQVSSFKEYISLLSKKGSGELDVFINAITTNETWFFRHEGQFTFLEKTVLPSLVDSSVANAARMIKIWSAASSTGEEPYSIAMICDMFFQRKPGWTFQVLASDINTEVLDRCRQAIYPERSLRYTPKVFKERYFRLVRKGQGDGRDVYQVSQEIVRRVRFSKHNLLKPPPYHGLDVIFLRNVMIYFDKKAKQTVVAHLERSLRPGGYLFISLSESLFDIQTAFRPVQPGVFQKPLHQQRTGV